MRIFVLLPRVPYPIEKGDKLRAFHQLRNLAEGHELILCALSEEKVHPDAYTELIRFVDNIHFIPVTGMASAWNIVKAFFTGKPLQVGYYYNKKAQKRIDELIDFYQPDHIYAQLIRVAEYVKNHNIPKTLDYQDAFSGNIYRRAKTEFFLWRPLFYFEAGRLKRYERTIFSAFDHKTIISAPDRDLIDHQDRSQINIIPNGVDTGFFYPREEEKIYDLVFVGNMNYRPNIDGAEYLVRKILPLVRKQYGEVRVLLSGANPHPRVRRLSGNGVEVTGWVDDIRDSYRQSKVFIAPMQIGTGLQNKLLEAMAMKIPSITSSLANDSLEAVDGEEILIGETPQDYPGHVITLLQDDNVYTSIAENGFRFVTEKYDWYKNAEKLTAIMSSTAPPEPSE
jgi:sugar transferase (PEP-CTERM/EpsH1 system associated)